MAAQRRRRNSGYESHAFTFRLTTRPEDKPTLDQLNAWLETGAADYPDDSRSELLRRVIVWLVEHRKGDAPVMGKTPPMGRIQKQLDRIEERLETGLGDVIRLLLQNPGAARSIANAAETIANGDAVGDDFVDNIIEDFER